MSRRNPISFAVCSLSIVFGQMASTQDQVPSNHQNILFESDLSDWVVEQNAGGRVHVEDGALVIDDEKGCTVWYRHELKAPVRISYSVTLSSEARVSDMNCFWMASDLDHPNDLFAEGHGRGGAFADYDDLQLYYVGYGGNYNATTRFRRYLGRGEKPLLPGFDLSESEYMIEGDRTYRIELIAAEGKAQYFRDGELVFEYDDPAPMLRGWFGFRTVWSKQTIRDLVIEEGGS